MRLLYISHLGLDKATGLCWSVPAGISAQRLFDDCFWINTNECSFEHWERVGVFHSIKFVGGDLSLKEISRVFPNPDVVVFEGFYHLEALPLANELYKAHIPYIIVPRGSLTRQAVHNHSFLNYIKKKVAVALLFRRYTRRALAIQYLTESEYNDSGKSWNKNHFILPNGITLPTRRKTGFSNSRINMVFIGRPTIYHKGLDVLISACKKGFSFFMQSGLTINCYVPVKNDYAKLVQLVKDIGVEDLFIIHSAVYGKEKEEVLLNTDVFVMTSRFEGHPMGLIEALSYGIPVAITPGTNMSSEVESNNAGWVSSCTPDGVCEMMMQIIAERNQLRIKGLNARVLSEQYEWKRIAEQFHNVTSDYLKRI